ncbi:fibronectin type III domain-containing protein [Candidatus Daviesbacteria bacterium]|nr:fibronectin type III domain-containing protein [Candidatus Daviesbacteria bacterium]
MRFVRYIVHNFFTKKITIAKWQFNLCLFVAFSAGILFTFGYLTNEYLLPKIFALNDTNKNWAFNASTAANYTYDTSLITVDNTGAHPVSGVNKLSNPAFASNNTSWSVAAVPPSGWVEVPGNATFSTTNFLIQKYEAKCAATSDLTTGLTTSDTGYRTWPDNTAACTSANSRAVVSVASGYPIANISQTTSVTRCSAVTVGSTAAHLQTNNEWMTITRNAEAQGSNWSGGSVNSGYLYAGHNDNSPALARVASTTDTGNNACAYTDSAGTTEAPSACPTNTSSGQSATAGNQKRVFTLSNGAYIWDIAGNVWEWTNDIQSSAIDTTAGWVEWNHANIQTGALALYGPSSASYLSAQGMGQVYGGALNNGFLRGGDWNDGANAGAFTLLLYNAPSDTNGNIGFRCASDPVAISQSFSSTSGRSAAGGNTITIGSVSDGKVYQSINVGDTSTYDLSVYAYYNSGAAIDTTVAQLYYNGSTVTTTYTAEAGSTGWYKLTGTITGVASSVDAGLLVKAGKTVKVDDFTLSKQGTYSIYTTSAYSNAQVNSWDTFCEGTLSGSTCTSDATHSGNASITYQICLDDGSSCSYTTGSRWQYYTAGAWANATDATSTYTNTPAQLTQAAMQALSITSQKISVKAILAFGGADTPLLPNISIGLTTDTTVPATNASSIAMTRSNGGTTVASNGWTNNSSPYFSWTAGADNSGGSGLKGYCLYLGADSDGDPATSKGLLGTTIVSTSGTTCQFITSSTSIDFATTSYRGSTWLSTSSSPYYLNIKAIDNSGNLFATSASFQFKFDNTAPTNTTYISCASGNFSNVVDMSFNWPTSGSSASSDSNSNLLGWQYQINSTSGTWLGTTTDTATGLTYMPTSATSRTLTVAQDNSSIVSGTNVIYFRTADIAGNTSSDGTIRTCNISYGGAAPSFLGTDTVTVTPSTSTSNSYALSWPAATPTSGQTVAHYYYMINTAPPSTYATITGNTSTYIDNGTTRTVSAAALASVNKGSNTVYVVAVDNASTPNYSPSNYITGTFTLNSTDPDNVGNLVASDSSIKSTSTWNATLTWTAPTYQGAGNLTYRVYRSTDNSTFSLTGTTTGLSYVDNTPSSAKYYYKIYTRDGASADSSGTNAVSITPTGKWTSAPTLSTGPSAGSITTKKSTITWTTSRSADSKIQYGTTSGSYGSVEPSNSDQVSSHSIQLTGLTAGTTYYYKAKWTDEDGNTGTSDEKSFATSSAPTVKDVSAKNIGLTSGIIQFTSKDASKVKIYYGKTTSFGGSKEISTSTSETTYTAELTGLDDGAKYYYKINTFDSDNSEYEGTVLDFTTLPRPKISGVRIQQVANTAQSTILVSWTTNTEVSSIVTYYPEGKPQDARDEVNVALTKGEHKMIVRSLLPQTDYILVVKGRDKIGNEASSDSQRLTTATDTRPPAISDLNVEGSNIPPVSGTAQEQTAQLVVSWNSDEPSTTQVEFGEGTGVSYAQKTQEDSNLTFNHLVIISNLTPSKVYHLRAISKDKAGNLGNSIDTVTITPKATENALNLVITNLQEAFGFLGGIGK